MSGVKYDKFKIRMDLLPPVAEAEIAKVLTYGAIKYKDWNWFKGMKWSRVLAALRRHLAKWSMGITYDKESGLRHSAQIACNAMFIVTFEVLGIGEDDRPKLPPEVLEKWEAEFDKLSEAQERLWLELEKEVERTKSNQNL